MAGMVAIEWQVPVAVRKYFAATDGWQEEQTVKSFGQARQSALEQATTRLVERFGPFMAGIVEVEWQVPVLV